MNVLIVKTSSLGDVIHTLPALTDAKKAIGDINFDWVIEESFVEIPEWHQAVKNIIPVAWRRWRDKILQAIFCGELLKFWQNLRHKKYDVIIDAQGLIKSAVIAKLARGKCFGYDKNSAREKQAAFFYKHQFKIAKDQHAITRIRQLFAAVLDYQLPNTDPDYGINQQVFPRSSDHDTYLVFFHGTAREEKCWAEQKWMELAAFAIANGYFVYLPWSNNLEFERAKRMAQKNNKIKILPKLTLTAIATLLQGAQGAVTVDTGLGHLAAALGVSTVSLYGPTNPKLIGSVGKNVTHLLNFEQLEAADVWQVLITFLKK